MGFTSFLSALFGNKSKRDLSKLMPIVEQIKAVEPSLLGISNDELRQKITEARTRIQESVADQRGRIAKLKEEIETFESDARRTAGTRFLTFLPTTSRFAVAAARTTTDAFTTMCAAFGGRKITQCIHHLKTSLFATVSPRRTQL